MAIPLSLKSTQATVDLSKFYVISICSNPVRYHSRYRLFHDFEKYVKDQGAKFITVEAAYGEREFNITQRDDPLDLQYRTDFEIWHKENMINLGVQYLSQLDPDWQYVAWIDADVSFSRPDIIHETVHQLQHYQVVQMFSHALDVGPNFEPLEQHNGFVYMYHENGYRPPQGAGWGGYYGAGRKFWHPGYAWAARREFFDGFGLMDKAILGAADHHMALGLIGEAKRSIPGRISKGYRQMVMTWQEHALEHVRRNIGYVPGTLIHHWHGSKKARKYVERWQILIDGQYNPNTDLTTDSQGLYRLSPSADDRLIRLRDDIRRYFRQRNEDSIDSY